MLVRCTQIGSPCTGGVPALARSVYLNLVFVIRPALARRLSTGCPRFVVDRAVVFADNGIPDNPQWSFVSKGAIETPDQLDPDSVHLACQCQVPTVASPSISHNVTEELPEAVTQSLSKVVYQRLRSHDGSRPAHRPLRLSGEAFPSPGHRNRRSWV